MPRGSRSPTEIRASDEIHFAINLKEPLGAVFKLDCTVEHVNPSGQLGLAGIGPGYRVAAAGGRSLATLEELKSVMQELKSQEQHALDVTFAKVGFVSQLAMPPAVHARRHNLLV